ncbi:hypothetical protein FRC17_008192, partial [Serendipita sp. 399]
VSLPHGGGGMMRFQRGDEMDERSLSTRRATSTLLATSFTSSSSPPSALKLLLDKRAGQAQAQLPASPPPQMKRVVEVTNGQGGSEDGQ